MSFLGGRGSFALPIIDFLRRYWLWCIALVMIALSASVSFAQTSTDWVQLETTSVSPIEIRNAQGEVIASVPAMSYFNMQVPGKTLKAAATESGFDAGIFVHGVQQYISRGVYYVAVHPASGGPQIIDKSGAVISSKQTVYIKVSDINVTGAARVVSAFGANTRAVRAANAALHEHDVTNIQHPVPMYFDRDSHQPGHARSSNEQGGSGNSGQFELTPPLCGSQCKEVRSNGRSQCSITSPFGERERYCQSNRKASCYHEGIDIGGARGMPIIAAADGVVDVAVQNRYSPGGREIILDHGNGIETAYLHMDHLIQPYPHRGQRFKRGDVIGYMGQTGHADGLHLHFGVKKNGNWVNPVNFLAGGPQPRLNYTCSELAQVVAKYHPGESATLSDSAVLEQAEHFDSSGSQRRTRHKHHRASGYSTDQ